MTGVFDSLSTDMHSNQITSSSYHSLHKSQESPTLPVSTATDSSYYNNNQQTGQCAGSPYGQISSYQYQNNSMNSVQYNTKSYELGFGNAFGSYGTYGSCSSAPPADAEKEESEPEIRMVNGKPKKVKIWFQNRRSKFKKLWKSGEIPPEQHVASSESPAQPSPPLNAAWDFAHSAVHTGLSQSSSSPPSTTTPSFLTNYPWYSTSHLQPPLHHNTSVSAGTIF
ncbi:hypothetical protein cypCar_00029048 [Cyprinus carpio]|nr:hypothetical protein cypCar_00029048 [Cyprinus carpio]